MTDAPPGLSRAERRRLARDLARRQRRRGEGTLRWLSAVVSTRRGSNSCGRRPSRRRTRRSSPCRRAARRLDEAAAAVGRGGTKPGNSRHGSRAERRPMLGKRAMSPDRCLTQSHTPWVVGSIPTRPTDDWAFSKIRSPAGRTYRTEATFAPLGPATDQAGDSGSAPDGTGGGRLVLRSATLSLDATGSSDWLHHPAWEATPCPMRTPGLHPASTRSGGRS